jgi:hypothetical protein
MLFSPEAHEPLVGEAWSAGDARAAIAEIAADAEEAFDDGWPLHPQDGDESDAAQRRFRTMYIGGAGVVAALHRLAQRCHGTAGNGYAFLALHRRTGEEQPPIPSGRATPRPRRSSRGSSPGSAG